MGQYHLLVNLDKRQFVHPHRIGNGLKLQEQVNWQYSTATALVMLLAASSQRGGRGGGDFHADHPLVGAWAGDRVAFIGDYAEPDDVPSCNAKRIFQECEAAGSFSETAPTKKSRKRWTNISMQVREMMIAEFGVRYVGDGWLNIVEAKGGRVKSVLAPDLVIMAKT